jgi:hypothetical protein
MFCKEIKKHVSIHHWIRTCLSFTWYHLTSLFAHTKQPQRVHGHSSPRYCGIDNEYQISSEPTNIKCDMFSTKLRGHCSDSNFCFFSATEALCVKLLNPTFSLHRLSFLKFQLILKLIIEHSFRERKKNFLIIFWVGNSCP